MNLNFTPVKKIKKLFSPKALYFEKLNKSGSCDTNSKTKMSEILKLDYVQVFNGTPATLNSFIAILDALHTSEQIATPADELIFVATIIHCKLSDEIKEKLTGNELKSWAELKQILLQKFKTDSTQIYVMLTEMSSFAANQNECLSDFANRLLCKLKEIKLVCGAESAALLKFAETNAIEKLRSYCSPHGQIALGAPQTLEEAKNILVYKGLGSFKANNLFESIDSIARKEMSGQPQRQYFQQQNYGQRNFNNRYQNFSPQFRHNYRPNFQYRSNENHQSFNGGFRQNFQNGNQQRNQNFNGNQRQNFNNQFFNNAPRNQNSNYQNNRFNTNFSSQNPNYQYRGNNMNYIRHINASSNNSVNPSSMQNQRTVSEEEYNEFLQFKAQKNEH